MTRACEVSIVSYTKLPFSRRSSRWGASAQKTPICLVLESRYDNFFRMTVIVIVIVIIVIVITLLILFPSFHHRSAIDELKIFFVLNNLANQLQCMIHSEVPCGGLTLAVSPSSSIALHITSAESIREQ
jgi:hypothetical protein